MSLQDINHLFLLVGDDVKLARISVYNATSISMWDVPGAAVFAITVLTTIGASGRLYSTQIGLGVIRGNRARGWVTCGLFYPPPPLTIVLNIFVWKEVFYLMTHSKHFIYGYMASDIWLRTILIVREETRCRNMGNTFRIAARVLLYAPFHRQDSTYHGFCYTIRGTLAGTRNTSMGPP